jgi:peptidoglycan/xylan/chitin deacetylase (PgdA/CDA1 family)
MKEVLSRVITYSGLPYLIRELFFRKKVTILVYHDPKPEVFEEHLTYLAPRYRIIPLGILIEAIINQDWHRVPDKSLSITIDDGHMGNHKLINIVRDFQIPITIFVCAEIIDTNRHFWFLDYDVEAEQLKTINNQNRLDYLRARGNYEQDMNFENRQALSEAEIKEMEDNGIDFQSHSSFHPILTMCSDDESRMEIKNSKSVLEGFLRRPITVFAYPNGNYSEREIQYIREAGYRAARSLDLGWNGLDTNIFALKSIVISDNASLYEMIVQSSGIFRFYHLLRDWLLVGNKSEMRESGVST